MPRSAVGLKDPLWRPIPIERNFYGTHAGLTEGGDMASEFWDDLAEDLEDPDFLREYVVESVRIATIDSIMNTLLDALNATGLSKTGLAKVIHQQPAAIRRLFSSSHVNPT